MRAIAEFLGAHRKAVTVGLAVLGMVDVGYYIYCRDSCSYLQGTLAGFDLKYVGLAFMILVCVLSLVGYTGTLRLILAGAVGGEFYLVPYQFVQGVFCPFCFGFAAIVLAAFAANHAPPRESPSGIKWFYSAGEVKLPLRNGSIPLMLVMVAGLLFFVLAFSGSVTPAYGEDPLPSYGEGKAQIRIYADYLCGPCREMEADIEPLLEKIIAGGKARVIYIDTPIHKETVIYARYYLCAARNVSHQEAIRVRRALFAAGGNQIAADEALREFLGKAGIQVSACDVSAALKTMNAYLQNDEIKSTPTCVIVTAEGRTVYSGRNDIVAALKLFARVEKSK